MKNSHQPCLNRFWALMVIVLHMGCSSLPTSSLHEVLPVQKTTTDKPNLQTDSELNLSSQPQKAPKTCSEFECNHPACNHRRTKPKLPHAEPIEFPGVDEVTPVAKIATVNTTNSQPLAPLLFDQQTRSVRSEPIAPLRTAQVNSATSPAPNPANSNPFNTSRRMPTTELAVKSNPVRMLSPVVDPQLKNNTLPQTATQPAATPPASKPIVVAEIETEVVEPEPIAEPEIVEPDSSISMTDEEATRIEALLDTELKRINQQFQFKKEIEQIVAQNSTSHQPPPFAEPPINNPPKELTSPEPFTVAPESNDFQPLRSDPAVQPASHTVPVENVFEPAPELSLVNATFCSAIQGFGQITRFADTTFSPAQRVLAYMEVENFQSVEIQQSDGTKYLTRLLGHYQITDQTGKTVQQGSFPVINDWADQQRTEFYLYFQIEFERLQPGDYRLQLSVDDQTANRSTSLKNGLPFTIK